MLYCKTCKREREESFFSPHAECKSGYDTSRCKPCKKAKQDWKSVPLEKRILNRVKARAKRRGLEFNLELSDIILPNRCPVLDIPFEYNHKDWTYSLDRTDNFKGYIKGNVQIISNKANRIKGDATVEELQKVLNHMRACEVTF